MNFTAPVKTLLAALAPCAKIAGSRTTIPILSHVLIEACAQTVAFVGNDLDKTVRAAAPAAVTAPGRTTVEGRLLFDILRKLRTDADVAFELGDKGVTLRSGRARFVLSTLEPDDFPIFDERPFPCRFSLGAKLLATMLAEVSYAISAEETRYYLNGVYLHVADDALRMVATDGHRLARRDCPLPDGAEGAPGVIVPRTACAEIERLAGAAEGDVTIALSDNQMRADFGAIVLTTKLIDGTFPDYRRVIPQNPNRLTLDREALAEAIGRVATLSSERGRTIKLSLSEEQLTVSVDNPDAGSAREEIEARFDAPAIEIGFNAAYLLETLATLQGDQVVADLASPGDPTTWRDPARADLINVLMPARV